MPIIIRASVKDEEAALPAPAPFKLPGEDWSYAATWRWRDLMEQESYLSAFNKMVEMVPDTKDILPILVDVDRGRTNAEKTRIQRAHKAVAKSFANFIEKRRRFQPEYRYKALDTLKDDLMRSRVLWEEYEVEQDEGKSKKPKRRSGNNLQLKSVG